MKKLLLLFAMVLSLNLANRASAQVYGSISFNTFYNELSPYGRWVNDIDYGQVWIADAPGFEPYYNNGHWTYTTYGWTWVSDYPWGWAPFHYGRWAYLPAWGWAWVPGYEWGPAWVSWCQNDGYFGWAPLGPGYGYYRSFNAVPHNYWRFVPQQYITGPELRDRIVRPDRNPNLFRHASFINNREVHDNVTYNIGPRREAVERITRQRIATKPVAFMGTDEKRNSAPAKTGTTDQQQVRLYRPEKEPGQAAANNGNRAVVQDRLPKNNPITKGEAVQQSMDNNAPASDAGSRPVRMLPKDKLNDNKNGFDNQQSADHRRITLEKRQAAQAQRNSEERPLQNSQPDLNRQARDGQRRQWQQQAEQQRQDQLNKQQALERRQQLQAQQDEQRRQQDRQRKEQQLQQQAQQEEQRRQQVQLDQQRREQQQRDNDFRQQQREQQRQQQAEQRRQQLEQRQNDVRQQRMQQQDNFQRQTEQRTQRSFDRPVRNFPNRKPIEK